MMSEELAHTNTSAQIRLGADAHAPIATLGWVDTRQEVSMTPEERAEGWRNANAMMEVVKQEGDGQCERAFDFLLAERLLSVAEEREGCAQMADYVCKCALHDELMPEHVPECRIRNEIAASIRARGQA